MSQLLQLLALANQEAETGQDMSVASVGGAAKLFPAGWALCRLVEYVELGSHPQSHNGVAKAPAKEAQLGFAVWGDGIQNDDGSPAIVRPYSFNLSNSDLSKAFKLFKKLNWKGTAKRFSQLLGEVYMVNIVHTTPTKAGQAVKSVLDLTSFTLAVDPMSKQPYNVPQVPDSTYKLFLWDAPNPMMWQSLYQEGQYGDGTSKNKMQNACLSALDFEGSALHNMLASNGIAFTIPPKPVAAAAAPVAAALPAAPAVPVVAALGLPGVPSLVVPAVAAPAVMPADVPFVGGVIPEVPTVPVVPAVVAPAVVAPQVLNIPTIPVIPAV
jgi:hypothetical protein